jgi:hypothetical protein
MSRTSVVPATVDALVAIVKGLTEMVDAAVAYDRPVPFLDESVWFGAVEPWEQSLATMPGGVFRDERFVVDGVIAVLRPGNSAVEARDRAFVLLAAIEEALRANLDLGVDGVLKAVLTPRSSKPYEQGDGEGRVHEIEFAVEVSGFLQGG